LRYTLLIFKFLRKNIRVFLFKKRQSIKKLSDKIGNTKNARQVFFRGSKTLAALKFNIYSLSLLSPVKLFFPHLASRVYLQSKAFGYPAVIDNKTRVFYKAKFFLRANNLQFVIKKKLNLRKQKTFFYSVHIAAPKKKTKK
jgi:hypothetical protein